MADEFTGLIDAVLPETFESKPEVSRKTEGTKEKTGPKQIKQSEKSNVLNKYRSATYNFTLSALRSDIVNQPEKYRDTALDLIILKSGGKGTTGFIARPVDQEEVRRSELEVFDRFDSRVKKAAEKKVNSSRTAIDLVDGFNQNSPGRFDMFIEDVEIETTMAFGPTGGTTLPTSIRFRVIEPYSINGFIEALHVSAVAAGYINYSQASFLLKMEFVGYPDDDNFSFKSPRVVEQSTRYFPIKFANIEVEVGERGTTYRCSAIPWNEIAFGQANVLKRPITMAGSDVKGILQDLAKKLNSQIQDDDKKSKSPEATKDFDSYEILFPERAGKTYDYNKTNIIGQSPVQSILRDNNIYKFPDPGKTSKTQTPEQKDAAPEEVKLNPGSGTPPQVQFAEGQRIHEIIAAVVRDSEYVKNILKLNKIDSNGFIDYFIIKSEVINKSEIDPVSRKFYQNYRFIVLPYKVHYTKIPGYKGEKFDPENITRLSIREYNYIYTGLNVDVLNFKLQFNNLFFEAMPTALGNNDQPGARDSAAPAGDSVKKLNASNTENDKKDQTGTAPRQARPLSVQGEGGNASQRDDDPYYNLARNMHSAIIDSKSSMITGELEILGDPVYIVTGGIGNYDAKAGNVPGLTSDGDADHLQGEVLITINFRNPVDIQPLAQGGTMFFEPQKLPFSGVYMITDATSTFKNGEFRQNLKVVRYPGQIIGNVQPTSINQVFAETVKPQAQPVEDTTQGENRGIPITETNARDLVNRGLPSPGLPGILSNFVGLAGGLGGQASSLVNQVSGALSRGIGNLTSANSVFGSIPGGINQLATGIRMQTSGLLNSLQSGLSNAASVGQAGSTIQTAFGIAGATAAIATTIKDRATAASNLISVKGSGIGEGASIKINPSSVASNLPTNPNNVVAATDLVKTTAQLPTSISLFSGQAKDLGQSALSSVQALGAAGASNLIGGVGNKISNVTAGLPTDPSAVAAKFGINPQQLSGLGGNLQSKVLGQLGDLANKIPEDANLPVAAAKGLSLNYIPVDKLKNIPATAPYTTAPKPEVDRQFLAEVAKSGGPQAVASAFGTNNVKNISGDLLPADTLNDVLKDASKKINNPIVNLPNVNLADASALGGKLSSAKNLLSSVSPITGSVESNIGSIVKTVGAAATTAGNLSTSVVEKFGSSSSGKSPLDKLFDKG